MFRSWFSGALRAAGATVLVPLGLALGIAVTASVGGVGLGGLGQVLGGPTVPDAGAAIAPGDERAEGPLLPAVPAPRAPERRAATASEPAPAQLRPRRGAARPDPEPAPRRRTPSRPRPPATSTPPAPDPEPTQRPRPDRPQPEPESPLRQLGNDLAGTVRELPAVGPPAADVVDTVVDLVAPPPRPRAAAPP